MTESGPKIDDVRGRLSARVVSSRQLLDLERVSRRRGYSQNLDPEWLETVIAPAGHHVLTPGPTHPARTADEEAHHRSMVRIQLRDDLDWTDAAAMLSLLDLPFENFEALAQPSVGVVNWLAELTTERIPAVAQVAEQQRIAEARPSDTPGGFPIWGTIVWFTPDQGGRRTGIPLAPWSKYYSATAFVPPSGPGDGLASVVIDVSVRNAWRSHAKLRCAHPAGASRGRRVVHRHHRGAQARRPVHRQSRS